MNKSKHNISHSIIVILLTFIKAVLFLTIGTICIIGGYFLIKSDSIFYVIVFGVPLILIGASMIIINFFSFIEVTVIQRVNQVQCPFCNREKIS